MFLDLTGEDGRGWASIEHVLVRINTTYTPQGKFPHLSDSIPDKNGVATFVGHDAAVCLELFEPWIVDVYNSTTGVPQSSEIIGAGNENIDASNQRLVEKRISPALDDPNTARQLNSSKMVNVLVPIHCFSQIVKVMCDKQISCGP